MQEMRYSVEPRGRIFVKDYWLLTFTKNLNKDRRKNISTNLNINSKYNQKILDHANQ